MTSKIVIFGATGDLAKHKLFPALEELNKEQKISIIAVGRKPLTTKSFCEQLSIKTDFLNKITYVQGEYAKTQLYSLLEKSVSHTQITLYYLATPPTAFSDIIKGISSTVLGKHARILIEKPFGTSLATAEELHKTISNLIPEKQVYRVDHYLGKSMISNIVHIRELTEFQPWNNKRIKAVQITAFETKGTEGRGQYYDKTGALKDMIQSHLLQILSLISMQPPCKTHQECKAHALEKFVLKSKTIIRGQYKGYLSEEHVAPNSQTETFIQLTLLNNLPEWKNVPFTITSGKKMPNTNVEVQITLEDANLLAIQIQPEQKITFSEGKSQKELTLSCKPCTTSSQQAYTTIFKAALEDNQKLFVTWEELSAAWKLIDKIAKIMQKTTLIIYDSKKIPGKELNY